MHSSRRHRQQDGATLMNGSALSNKASGAGIVAVRAVGAAVFALGFAIEKR